MMDSAPETRRTAPRSAGSDNGNAPPQARDRVEADLSSDPNLLRADSLQQFGNNITPGPQLVSKAVSGPVWMQRVWLVVFVMFSIELGMVLAVLPWTRVWNENSLMYAYPTLRAILQRDFVRGAITGLGLLDIWIGIWEAVHYRERK